MTKKINKLLSVMMVIALMIIYLPKSESVFAAGGDPVTFVVDGIKYQVTSEDQKEVSVIKNDPIYSGNITIPATVTHDEVTYTVTSIGSWAFNFCTGLTSITLPSNGKLTSIGACAFCNCTSLTNITLPDSVESIGIGIFESCNKLESITLPNNNAFKRISSQAFKGCTALTNITIPDSVTSISSSAFKGCTTLTNITIPDGVTIIDNEAFNGCTTLTNIIIPDNVTSIGKWAFNGCAHLTSITIPNSVTSIDNQAFDGCTNLNANGVTINYVDNSKKSSDSCSLTGKITNFTNMMSVKQVTIDDSVESIGEKAFSCCNNLTNIEISNNVKTIGNHAFEECKNLAKITLPNGVESIGEQAFIKCEKLTEINLPNSITSIGEQAFNGCKGLTSITIPDNVTSISDSTFGKCTNLTSITFSETSKLNSIGVCAFLECGELASITIPSGVKTIGALAFGGCNKLTFIDPTKDGYTFDGWYSDEACSPDKKVAGISTSPSPITIWAKWTGITYSITYNLNGGTNPDDNLKSYTCGTGLTLKNPTREGYTFEGWYDNAECTGSAITEISTTDTENKELWAKWIKNPDPQPAPNPIPTYTPDPHDKETTTEKISEVAKNLEDGDKLTIKPTAENKSLKGDVLKEIKGKDIEVKIKVADGIEWSFNGKDIPENWDPKDINFNLNTEKSEIPTETLKTFTEGKKSKTLSLDYDGEFGFEMQLSVHIGYFNEGQYANIYYYNPTTKELEFMGSSKINSAGNAKFNFKHASDYVILVANKPKATSDKVDTTTSTADDTTTDTSESNPKTGHAMPISIAILSLAAVVVVTKKKFVK